MTIKPLTVALSSVAGAPAIVGASGVAESIPQSVTFSIFATLFFAFLGYLAKESKAQREEQQHQRNAVERQTAVLIHTMGCVDDAMALLVDSRNLDSSARERAVSRYFRAATAARERLATQLTDTQEIPNAQ